MPDNILIMLRGHFPQGVPSYVLAFCWLTTSIRRRLFAKSHVFYRLGICMNKNLHCMLNTAEWKDFHIPKQVKNHSSIINDLVGIFICNWPPYLPASVRLTFELFNSAEPYARHSLKGCFQTERTKGPFWLSAFPFVGKVQGHPKLRKMPRLTVKGFHSSRLKGEPKMFSF